MEQRPHVLQVETRRFKKARVCVCVTSVRSLMLCVCVRQSRGLQMWQRQHQSCDQVSYLPTALTSCGGETPELLVLTWLRYQSYPHTSRVSPGLKARHVEIPELTFLILTSTLLLIIDQRTQRKSSAMLCLVLFQ